MRILFLHSIQIKIGITALVFTTLVLSGFGVYEYLNQQTTQMNALNGLADRIIERLADNLVNPLWTYDKKQLEKVMLSEMKEPSILAMIIQDQATGKLQGKRRNEQGQVIDAAEKLTGNFLTRSKAIIRGDKRLGTVTVYLTYQLIRTALRQFLTSLVVMVFTLDAVLLLFLTISLRLILIRPIARLLKMANAIAEGNFSQAIMIRQRDEIGALAQTFHNMRAKIALVLNEMTAVIRAIQEGRLTVRGQAEQFTGGWQELVVGFNRVIEAFTTPFHLTTNYLDRLSSGDIPEKITEQYPGDFSRIKESLNRLIATTQEITQLAEEMAQGNLTVTVNERSEQDRLMHALNVMAQRLDEVVGNVKLAADHIASESQTLNTGTSQMSESTTEQAAAVEEVSASMEQMAATIHQNADKALHTEKIARAVAEDASQSGEAVNRMVLAMRTIAKKIQMIEQIAQQTHILSLNATIESAKAQEYGKGFAVVASEVRSLAERSRKVAAEINDLVRSSEEIAGKAGEMLSKLVPDIQQTAEFVQNISAASREQEIGAEHINQAIQQMDQGIQHNAATAEEIATTVEQLTSQAEVLRETIAFFKVDETNWKTGIEEQPAAGIRNLAEKESRDHKGRIPAKDQLDEEFERY
jgi:methyl-accepting chemotaxis protein